MVFSFSFLYNKITDSVSWFCVAKTLFQSLILKSGSALWSERCVLSHLEHHHWKGDADTAFPLECIHLCASYSLPLLTRFLFVSSTPVLGFPSRWIPVQFGMKVTSMRSHSRRRQRSRYSSPYSSARLSVALGPWL